MEDSGGDPESPDTLDEVEDEDQKWHGYADYQNVAVDLRKELNKAVEAYSHLNARSSQGVSITPQTAVEAKSAILGITKRLHYEVQKNAQIEEFQPIYERWSGVELEEKVDGTGWDVRDNGDAGYVERLERHNFRSHGVPEWLDQLVEDLIMAGWELGYIRAGVEKPADPEDDEQQVEEMFE